MRRPLVPNRNGVTLIELMVATSVFGLLMTALFWSFRYGMDAWRKVEVRADLLGGIQLVTLRMSEEGNRSLPLGTSISPSGSAVAIISPRRDDGKLAYDSPSNSVQWQRYALFWHDETKQQILSGDVPLSPTVSAASPIEGIDPNWFTSLAPRSRVLAPHMEKFEVTSSTSPPRLLFANFIATYQRAGATTQIEHRSLVKIGP